MKSLSREVRQDKGTVGTSTPISSSSNVLRAWWARIKGLGVNAGGVVQNPPIVRVNTVNPGEITERRMCFAVSGAPDLSVQCANLLTTYSLPATRVRGQSYAPTLVYNSQTARPYPLVGAIVVRPSGSPTVTSMKADLSVAGCLRATHTWTGLSSWAVGATRRITLGWDMNQPCLPSGPATNFVTHMYPYTLTITLFYSNGTSASTPASGTLLVVNQAVNNIGSGWAVLGYERIYSQPDSVVPTALPFPDLADTLRRLLWYTGDGSARLYLENAEQSKLFTVNTLDRVDTLEQVVEGGQDWYDRQLRGGGKVRFNGDGYHYHTEDRHGFKTEFSHYLGNGNIRFITLPNGQQYEFLYNSLYSQLERVRAPQVTGQTRETTFLQSGLALVTITDPLGKSTEFQYGYPNLPQIMSRRRDRRGSWVEIGYDGGRTVSSITRFVGSSPSGTALVTQINAAQTRGFPTATIGDSAAAFTFINGPRTDSADVTQVWHDRYGAVAKVMDAHNHVTTIARTNATYPGLVTQVNYPGGFQVSATHDGNGKLTSETAISAHAVGVNATTFYRWSVVCERVARVIRPENDSTVLAFDSVGSNPSCNVAHAQDGRGDTTRTTYSYHSTGLLKNLVHQVTDPSGAVETYQYTTSGNLQSIARPGAQVTTYAVDAVGRVTSDTTYLNVAGTLKLHDSTAYDALDRDTLHLTSGPAISRSLAQTAQVKNTFDEEGNLLTVRRLGSTAPSDPNLPVTGELTTQWTYDRFHRKLTEISPGGASQSWQYDGAGNDTLWTDRNGRKVRKVFNARNLLSGRTADAVTFAQETWNGQTFPKYGTSLSFTADVATFTYDGRGRLIQAANNDAIVRRGYTNGGAVAAETLNVREYNPASTNFTRHEYVTSGIYDRNGRRTQRSSSGTEPVSYTYDTNGLGALSGIGGIETYQYDRRGLPRPTTGLLTNTSETYTWNAAGWLERRELIRGGSTKIQADTLGYDVTGRLISSRNVADTTASGFAGLGAIDYQAVLARGTLNTNDELFQTDPLGHLKKVASGCCGVTFEERQYQFDATTGRQTVMKHEYTTNTGLSDYDLAGNRVRHATYEVVDKWTGAGRVGFNTVTRSYYDPLGQLRVTDKRSPPDPQTLNVAGVPYWYLGAYEEYRYDALGRRVLKRSRRENCNEAFCPSHIERYVWDGNSILTEIRYPGANGLPFDSLERDTGYVYTLSTTQPPFPPPTQWDTLYSPHYGRVSYIHGTALDKPIAVRRYRYGRGPQFNQSWEDLTAYPHYNWKGLASGDKKALSLDPTTTDIEWAAKDARAYGQIPISTNAPKSWFGSLIIEQRDASGLHYRRARYYDPVTGRFTQEDPIGLAGGLNLYGYANGDPVNFSDPFGLYACEPPKQGCNPVSARGEGRNVIIVYSDGETTTEQVRSSGTRAWRNNNPGNMRNSPFSQGRGSLGEAGGFAVFGSEGAGASALGGLLGTSTYQGLTINDAITRYAPPIENNTANYQKLIGKLTGLQGDLTIGSLNAAQLRSVVGAIRAIEGWSAGSVTYRKPQ